MFDIPILMVLIPAFPLAGTIVTAIFGKWLKHEAHWPVVVAIACSSALSLMLLSQVAHEAETNPLAVGWEETFELWNWTSVPEAIATPEFAAPAEGAAALPARLPFVVNVTLRSDPLTSIMLAVVTFVASLVAIYAIGYMHGDPGYWRFFTYIGLFVFSMTMLVSVSNFVLLYVFWEAVGLCSYLLVGFWYEKPSAIAAGKKAFLVNRVGDFGFALGLFLIWITYGTLNYHDADGIAGVLGQTRLAGAEGFAAGGVATTICLLLMLGACGKSAQFPLHVWLPDAMEGPTPVSALIHAATMVTAGVYMVTRCTPLFVASAEAQQVVAIIGATTLRLGRCDRIDADGSQARVGLLDDQPVGLHVPGLGLRHAGRHHGRHVSPDHARVLQSAVVPGCRQRDARHGGHHRHAALQRFAQADALHALDVSLRRLGAGGRDSLCRFLEQGRHPGRDPRARARFDALSGLVLGRHDHGFSHRDLYVPGVLPHVLRTVEGAARVGTPRPRVAAHDDRAADDSGRICFRGRHVAGRAGRPGRVAGAHAVIVL